MSAVEPVMRRVRAVVGTAGNETFDAPGARLVLRAVLFDGDGPPEWHRAAACADADPNLFHPATNDLLAVAAAKRVCRACPVRGACLADAMAWEPITRRHGIAGGLTPTERRRLHDSTRSTSADTTDTTGSTS
jgi:WhiB family transcriptional regulator, redox-sensing transcriptional regulator